MRKVEKGRHTEDMIYRKQRHVQTKLLGLAICGPVPFQHPRGWTALAPGLSSHWPWESVCDSLFPFYLRFIRLFLLHSNLHLPIAAIYQPPVDCLRQFCHLAMPTFGTLRKICSTRMESDRLLFLSVSRKTKLYSAMSKSKLQP